MNRFILLFTGLFLVNTISAQSVKHITLAEAVALGLTNSHALQLSGAKVAAANAKYQQAIDQTLPTLKLTAGYTRLSDIDEVKLDLKNDGNLVTFIPNIPNTYNSHLALGETIFSGFRLKYAKESYQLMRNASRTDAEKDSQEVVMNVIAGLFNLYKIHQTEKIIEENISLAQNRVKESEEWEKNGIATHNELLKWQLQLSNTQLAKIDLDNTFSVANFNLNLLLGLDGNQILEVDSASLFAKTQLDAYTAYDAASLKSRSDLQVLVLRNSAAQNNLQIAKNGYWPQIAVGANYYYSRPNSRIFPPTDEFKSAWDVGINLTFDLVNLYSNRHSVSEMQANLEQSKAQQAILSDQIRTEVNKAYISVTQSTQREEVLTHAVEQAEENYRITENKYRSQLILQSELQDADYSLLNSRIEKVNASADTQLSYYRLLKASGQLAKTY